ncbi:arginine--tRNA ligase [Sulfobacillus harzensis]|uniref:Arginine--tRNA ligase n=1 Tax=Sulfobacillus harzensis TaxID=2729629 RepID=A0A7Y0Q2A2_9FIRM|nr:arginine--tRNA ligase [Sulfobacillus harzensis]NMP20974.1 arginine--tRNA ligase [Sulfobacillus harzensis]
MPAVSRLDEARQEIRRVILDFLEKAGLPGLDELVRLDVPTESGHGDLTTSFALKVASRTKQAPRALLQRLVDGWPSLPMVEAVEIAGPGFLNFTLNTAWLAEVVNQVRANPGHYGDSDAGQHQKVLLEYVSANPTGPMVVVSGRAAAVGDTLARVMAAAGFHVSREFYVNDAGNQIATLGHALALRLRELGGEDVESAWPEKVYPGDYVKDLARAYIEENPELDARGLTEDDYPDLGSWAAERIRKGHEETLRAFRVEFDQWFSERSLREAGAPESVIDRLRERGYIVERDGALWFTSTMFGDDKDRVMVKSDGSYTYFVPDAAYHAGKFDRGYDFVIDLLGPDHHGYVNRMRAVVEALGYPPERLEILIVQLVRLLRGHELVRMSKRGGDFVALEDLIEEAGVDPARFFLLERAPETPMDFDLNLATLKGSDNPVYYVQYAGARIHSVLRQWRALGADTVPVNLALLTAPEERELVFLLARFPEVIVRVAEERAPQHLTKFMTDLAAAFHTFYRAHRILDAEAGVRQARLALIEAVLAVNTRGLALMGISQPEEM